MASKLVYNIEPASPTMISSLDRHCLHRVPDGSSNIVVTRTPLNKVLVGDERGLMASLREFYAKGVKRPAKQSERPYLRIVASASPAYFRPNDPADVGTWDVDRLAAWIDATMNQMKAEHGDDLVFAHLHLDEDTPHIHAVVAPTYTKKARKPGRKKRGETNAEFEARKKAAQELDGVRAVGRASHPTLSKKGSFQRLRERMAVAVDHLGIEYGEDREITAGPGLSTRQWVIQHAAEIRAREARVEQREKELEEQERAHATKVKQDSKKLLQERIALEAEQLAFDAERQGYLETEKENLAIEKAQHAAEVEGENEQIAYEWSLLENERSLHEAERADLERQKQSFEIEKQAEAASQAKTAEWIERGVQNLQVAIDRAQAGTHDTEISATDMSDQPLKYEVLKNAAPDNRPTLGFRARFWALNFSDGSGPAPLPSKVRTSLTKAFDRVAAWAVELRRSKLETQQAVSAAQTRAGAILAKAEASAAEIMQEARARGNERASVDAGIRGYSSFVELMKTKIRQVFGDEGYDRVAKEVNEEWVSHPDNLDRPLTHTPRVRSGPSGPPSP
ncbi:hypothetical protein E2L08_15875 [Palleronia sediminis]|uniref:Plasmid recombination enzyme n=1 Tax=Palleronia sediminis TaxID=2547833 RepID=A0A4V3B8F8_9RHOB|nr:plasmid recombination protein [Palleronia sediminis]TDL74889.1 hypothetical protein E2L08_15875 [Palleronia sediminis]